ncbi:MAG: Uncharacterised protein [Polaribacter sejongensis]|nr:MAG: Uncharacterised protein [Polaribacter sejongensis]
MQLTKFYNYSFLLVASFPLFSIRISTFILAFWFIMSVIVLFKKKSYNSLSKVSYRNIAILSLYYIFLLVNYIFSGFDNNLIKFLETDALFLLFPLFIFINKDYIATKTLKNILLVFFGSNLILAMICWFKIFQTGFFKLLEKDSYYHPVFRGLFAETTGIHLPYLGLFFVFSIFIAYFFIIKTNSKKHVKILVFLSSIVLLASIVTFSARMALGTFFVIIFYLTFKEIKGSLRKISTLFLFTSFAIILVINSPVKKRIAEIFNTKLELPSGKLNDKSHLVNFRYGIYYCSYNIIKNDIFVGIGKNNVSESLQLCYDNFSYNNFDDFKKRNYNTHNQYIDLIISYGVFGFIILFSSIFYGWYHSKSSLYKVFLITIFLALLTENLFARQLGVVFFTLFNTLFFIIDRRL